MTRCPTCHELMLTPHHRCNAVWHVEILSGDEPAEEELRIVYARNAGEAAEKAVAAWDTDKTLARGEDEIDAVVYDDELALVGRYRIMAYTQPIYAASPVGIMA